MILLHDKCETNCEIGSKQCEKKKIYCFSSELATKGLDINQKKKNVPNVCVFKKGEKTTE